MLGKAISPGIRPSFGHPVGFIWAIFPYVSIHLSDTTLWVSWGFAAYDVNEGLTKAVMKCNCKAYTALGVSVKNDSTVIDVSQCEGAICQFHFREDMVLNETVVEHCPEIKIECKIGWVYVILIGKKDLLELHLLV